MLLKGDPYMFPSLGNDGTEDYLDETALSVEGKAAAVRVLYIAKCLLAIKSVIVVIFNLSTVFFLSAIRV